MMWNKHVAFCLLMKLTHTHTLRMSKCAVTVDQSHSALLSVERLSCWSGLIQLDRFLLWYHSLKLDGEKRSLVFIKLLFVLF